MNIFKRVSDIVSANLNDLVEKFEDPEPMLRQAVREMEDAISRATREVARHVANEKMLARELARYEAECGDWSRRATTAVAAGDDPLARKALSRKRECEKIIAAMRDQIAAANEASGTLRRQLDGMRAKLADARRRLGTLIARKRAADVRARIASSHTDVELDQDAFAKFERLERKVEFAEAEAEAMVELSAGPETIDRDELAAELPSGDVEIEAELAALKQGPSGR